jgi:hypothetical protein
MRHCACPLEEPMVGMPASVKYRYGDRCRKRAYRAKLKREAERVGLQVAPTLKAVEAANRASARAGHAENARKRPQKRPTELRVSYRKAVGILAVQLGLPTLAVESALEPALTPRQRRALFEREAA